MSSSTGPAPMSEERFREFMENIQNKWNNLENNNETPDYLEKLRPILGKDEYKITNIVMFGIGNPPNLHHLGMLLALRDYFTRDADIEIVCQEQLNPLPKKYKDFMASKGIELVSAEDKNSHKPLADQMNHSTLVFAPTAGTHVMRALKKAPELYIGVSMERQEAVCLAGGNLYNTLRMDAQVFRENTYDCAKLPAFLSAAYPTDSNPLVLYRRTKGSLNGSGENQPAWKSTAPHWTEANLYGA